MLHFHTLHNCFESHLTCIYHSKLNQSPTDGHLGYFQTLVIINNAKMNAHICFHMCIRILLDKSIFRADSVRRIPGSKSSCICTFLDTAKLPSLCFEPFYTITSNVLDFFPKAMLTECQSLDFCYYNR